MRHLGAVLIPAFMSVLAVGCAANGQKSAATTSSPDSEMTAIMEQIDSNAAEIRETKSQLGEISRRLSNLENELNTRLTEQSMAVNDIKENITFMNDQMQRLDTAISSQQPAPRPQPANVFRPGGFDVSAAYKGALDEYYSRRYESAISAFSEILTVAPNNDLADNAQYWIGESYYAMGNYQKALDAFNKVFNFPESNKIPDAHLKIALTHRVTGDTATAREELQAVISNYPDAEAAGKARTILNSMGN